MAAGLREVDTVFLGAMLSTLLYGFYVAVAYECTRMLWMKRKHRRVHKYLVATHVVLFVLVNLRCITTLVRCLIGLRFHQQPDGSINTGALNSAQSMIANSAWFLCILVSDAFIIYRVHVVWRANYYVVTPLVLGWVGNAATGVWLLYTLRTYGPGASVFEGLLTPANIAFIAFTLYTNLAASLLIAYRIWHVRRGVEHLTEGRDAVSNLVGIILESAGFYTILLVVHIILLGIGSFVEYVCTDMEAPVIGIVFSYIIIRVSEGVAHGNTSSGGPTSGDTSGPRRTWNSGARPGVGTNTIDVAIRLETVTHHDRYGHATRVSALATHLLRLPEEIRPIVYLVSSAPQHVFADSRAWCTDVQCAGDNGGFRYQVDRRKSVEVLKAFLQRKDILLETEASWLREICAQGILSDAAFLGCLAAKEAGIPSILITNFTFDSVYSYLGTPLLEGSTSDHPQPDEKPIEAYEDNPIPQAELEPLVNEIISGYRCADLLLCLPGCIPIPSFSSRPALPAPDWVDSSTNTLLPDVIQHLLALRSGAPQELHPPTTARGRPRAIVPAPLLVRPASMAEVYTPSGRAQYLSSIGIPEHLHDRKILIVSFGGQVIRCPKSSNNSRPSSRSHTPSPSFHAGMSSLTAIGTDKENLVDLLSSSAFSQRRPLLSRIATPKHLWVPGAPAPVTKPSPAPTPFSSPVTNTQMPTFDALLTPTASKSQTETTPTFNAFAIPPTPVLNSDTDLASGSTDSEPADEPRLLPDDSWIAIICGVSKEQWAKEDKDENMPEDFFIAPKDVYMPDLTAVADCLLGKLGYGTVSECIDACTPFVYVSRPLFIEEHGLRLLLDEEGTGVELSRAAYEQGDWAGAVEEAYTRGAASKALKRALESRVVSGRKEDTVLDDETPSSTGATRFAHDEDVTQGGGEVDFEARLPQVQQHTRKMARAVVEWLGGAGLSVFDEVRAGLKQ
ncbi:hypothetical protein K523DRAFT_344632 [Schizophyllum commune Tattone D]|nr:hypothetical protein K523DRAFT_344632 [Schizophyllum commune Tattone D]